MRSSAPFPAVMGIPSTPHAHRRQFRKQAVESVCLGLIPSSITSLSPSVSYLGLCISIFNRQNGTCYKVLWINNNNNKNQHIQQLSFCQILLITLHLYLFTHLTLLQTLWDRSQYPSWKMRELRVTEVNNLPMDTQLVNGEKKPRFLTTPSSLR